MSNFSPEVRKNNQFPELDRKQAGLLWKNALLSLKDRNADVSPYIEKLRALSDKYQLPSLEFAAMQLLHFKQFGIGVLNIGGTMGCGKSSLAKGVAKLTGWDFRDADHFHSKENIAKMSAGIGLTDLDRHQFISDVKTYLQTDGKISTCSALATRYRAILAGQNPDILLGSNPQQDPWIIEDPRLGMLQVMVIKPYQRALEELDDSEKNPKHTRYHNGKKHFIVVTRESEAEAKAKGESGILAKQYETFNADPIDSWTYLPIKTQDFSGETHKYDGAAMLEILNGLPFIKR